jgi:hypothetical protein
VHLDTTVCGEPGEAEMEEDATLEMNLDFAMGWKNPSERCREKTNTRRMTV